MYSLGVVVYEMLTGHLPFEGGMAEMLLGHVEGMPAPMRRWGVKVSVGVERAVQRAMAKGPRQRWGSCEEFLRVLERPEVGGWSWGRRSEVYLGVGVAVLVVLGVVGLLAAGRGKGTQGIEPTPTMEVAVVPLSPGTPTAEFSGTRPLPPTPTLPRIPSSMPTVPPEEMPVPMPALPGAWSVGTSVPSEEIQIAEMSPGAEEKVVSSGTGAEVPVAPEERLDILTVLGTGMGPVTWGPGPHSLLLASGNQVYSCDLSSGQRSPALELDSKVFALALASDGRTLAIGDWKGFVALGDLQKGAIRSSVEGHRGGPLGGTLALAFAPDGALLASGGTDGRILLWDTGDLSLRRVCEGHGSWVRSLAFSPDGRVLASGGLDNALRLWDVDTCHEVQAPLLHDDWVMDVVFSPTGGWLASAAWDGEVRIWGKDGSSPRILVPDHQAHEVLALAFSPVEARLLVSGDLGGIVRLWDVESGRPIATPKDYGEPVVDLAFSPEGTEVVCALRGGEVKLLSMVRE